MKIFPRVTIIGAGGVLGASLVQYFSSHNYSINAVSRSRTISELEIMYNNIAFYNIENIEAAILNSDIIILSSFSRSQNGAELVSSIEFCDKIFKLSYEKRVPYIIYISSQSIYGNNRHIPSKETDSVCPFDMYALAKYSVEKLLGHYHSNNTRSIILRLSSLIGPQYSERVINKLLNKALETNLLSICGSEQIFSYLDIRDAVRAIVTLVEKIDTCNAEKSVYNIGSNLNYTLKEISSAILDFVYSINYKRIDINYYESLKTFNYALNSRLFINSFNWKPIYTLKDSIEFIYDTCYKR